MASPSLRDLAVFDPEAWRDSILEALPEGVNEEEVVGTILPVIRRILRECLVLLNARDKPMLARRLTTGKCCTQPIATFFANLGTILCPCIVRDRRAGERRPGFYKLTGPAVQTFWTEDLERVVCEVDDYAPPTCIRRGFTHARRTFSTYPGPGITLEEIDAADMDGEAERAAVAAWRDHVERRICRGDPATITAVMGFIASMVQRPGVKMDCLLCVFGEPGEGKGTLTEILTEIVGPMNVHKISQPSQAGIGSRFNGAIADCAMLLLDEVVWPGNKEAREMIKGLVSEKRQRVERKGVDSAEQTIVANTVITSNGHAVAVCANDRRVIACEILNELRAKPREELMELRHTLGLSVRGADRPPEELRRRLAAIARYMMDPQHLLSWNGTAPANDALEKQAAMTLDPAEGYVRSLLETNDMTNRIWRPPNARNSAEKGDSDNWIQCSALVDAMLAAGCSHHQVGPSKALGFLQSIFPDVRLDVRRSIKVAGKRTQVNCFLFPGWEECVNTFAAKFKAAKWGTDLIAARAKADEEHAAKEAEGFDRAPH